MAETEKITINMAEAGTHDQTATDEPQPIPIMAADQIHRHGSCCAGGNNGKHGKRDILGEGSRRAEGQVPNEVNGPYFEAGSHGPNREPSCFDAALFSRPHPFCNAQNDVGGGATKQHRTDGQDGITNSKHGDAPYSYRYDKCWES